MRMMTEPRTWHAPLFLQRACLAVIACLLSVTLVWGQLDLARMRSLAMQRYGADTANLVDEWYATIETMRDMPDAQKLETANNFFNRRIRWVQDPEAWGQKDYWATPLETMGNGMGDCEDFAIAKYSMLVLAGIAGIAVRCRRRLASADG